MNPIGDELRCSFCGKRPSEVECLISGSGHIQICNECVAECVAILALPVSTVRARLPRIPEMSP